MLGPVLDRLERRGVDRVKARDAIRRAVQATTGAVLAWTVLRLLPLEGYFVGILAAVLIVQPSADGTLHSAKARVMATVVGCAVGLACLLILPPGWGAITGLAVAMLILNVTATFRPDWTYGIVAAVALATAQGADLWAQALDRVLSIAVGAAIGIAVASLLWRDRARARFDRHMRAALEALADNACEATAKSTRAEPDTNLSAAPRFHQRLRLAREALDVMALDESDGLRARADAAAELMGAIEFLNRAAATPADLSGDPELGDALDRFRQAVAEDLRDPATIGGSDSDPTEGPVTQAQRDVSARVEAREVSDPRSATTLAFAMDEVDRALIALYRAWSPG
ncbi:FUSC family protein [Jannaschia ovalis]|uniref:FUSC family protein n=1 Tax=Jannaschia ovalis TaxID=3038773 RepID=A0ABY8LGW9_9RHOB|nr:FUSC family protein [Jannaschia sp. GRR-S6-38]WGH79348.1 FUSC family protein [Jannaschia sp. GRR-S6-38]